MAALSAQWHYSSEQSIDEQIASLRGALERVSALWPDNFEATAFYRIELACLIVEAGNADAGLSDLQALRTALADAKAPPYLLAEAIRAEAWYYVNKGRPQQALALLEQTIAKEMKNAPQELTFDYAWALVFAGEATRAEQQMRIAAYALTQRSSRFLDNALGVKQELRLQDPFDLAYVMIKANKTAEAAGFVAKEAPWACRFGPPEPRVDRHHELHWHEARERAVVAAYETVCPKEAKPLNRRPAGATLSRKGERVSGYKARPGTTRTLRGAAVQIAAADTRQQAIISKNAA